ncbi:MAG: flagellar export chaperone FliS [Burkholderiaceae bacterium]
MSFAHGARGYARVAVETGVATSDPHALVAMLYDGAIAAVNRAQGHLAAGRVSEKCEAIARATRIVDEGLKAGLDRQAGGALAERLAELYDYMVMRLLQANLRNDVEALAEVARLLNDLRSAWLQIGRSAPSAVPAANAVAARVAVAA